jgi:predicted nuclease of predicted toxin-antitoxin system
LSLKLLIDEDAQDKVLVKLLRLAGHEVITVNEAGLMSQPDFIVLDYATI